MKHARAMKLALSAWDAPLSEKKAQALRRHLQQCPVCVQRLSKLQALRRIVLGVHPPTPPSDLDAKVEKLIVASSKELRTSTRSRTPAFGLVAATAMAVLVAMVYLLPMERADDSPSAQQVVADDGPLSKTSASSFPAATTGRASSGQVATLELDCAERFAAGPATWTIHRPDEPRVIVELTSGSLGLSIEPHSFVDGLRVACQGTEFSVLSGTVALWTDERELSLDVFSGEVVLFEGVSGTTGEILGPGSYVRPSSQTSAVRWKKLSPSDTGDLAQRAEELTERTVEGQTNGTLPLSVVRSEFGAHMVRLRDCYEKALKRDPSLVVLTQAELRVDARGKVTSARLHGFQGEDSLRGCLTGVLEDIEFPAPRGGPVVIVAPLRLYPSD